MNTFNILDPSQEILESRCLEASAGTGKTFAIEHLIVRLQSTLKIDEILAVTFTRAAAHEMKTRLRAHLGSAIDDAAIYTIHGFCKRALKEFAFEANVHFSSEMSRRSLREVVCDVLRMEELVDLETLTEILKLARSDMERLIDRIIMEMQNGSTTHPALTKIVAHCNKRWEEECAKKEIYSPDRLLQQMALAAKLPAFRKKLQQRFKAVIIDEFQDTDPLSWQIFEELFVKEKSCLIYLVGDPKQSIYAFRKADVYTYMHAAAQIGKKEKLSVNYRSRPELVEVLNVLFSEEFSGSWIDLPAMPGLLRYEPVAAGRETGKLQGAAIHFFICEANPGRERSWPPKTVEEEKLFPYIAAEINTFDVSLNEIAVLVKDRFQAERLHHFLSAHGIPSIVKRAQNLTETRGFMALEELVEAVLHPKNVSAVKSVLLGPLICMSPEKINPDVCEEFSTLHEVLLEEGFAAFYRTFLKTKLASSDEALVREFGQSSELLMEKGVVSADQLVEVIRELKKAELDEEEGLKLRPQEDDEKVQIMTLFASKGLEFEIVFALGLASRHASDEDAEHDAEKMRQLYVALTRAREKLYIPLLFDQKKRPIPQGAASPMELFWKDKPIKALDGLPHTTYSWIGTPTIGQRMNKSVRKQAESEYLPMLAPFPKIYAASFTSLSNKDAVIRQTHPGEELPVGSETGVHIHALLEQIFEQNVQNHPLLILPLVKKQLYKTPLEGWEQEVYAMILKALDFPLKENFSLSQLSSKDLLVEMEFFYKTDTTFIKGFADLIFRHGGKYYLLDWKTNWLVSYTDECLREAMQDHDYFLQIDLYKEALRRYVKLFDNRPFDKIYGGAYYFFLRGPAVFYDRRTPDN